MPIAVGTKIGGYEVLGLVGSGGMGEVYRAGDPVLKREVAIKILPGSVAQDEDRLRRFEQEGQAAATLNHPNILTVYQFGSFDGSPYLVSELLEGATLRHSMERGPLAVRKALDYGIQIARGLAAAHDKGIVHRDLKPENLFLTKDGRIKILDFGLAKLTQPVPDALAPTRTHTTDPGMVMGTAGYMSPEQVRGKAVDHRADIFAFGAILYEMLAGKRAFQRSTQVETMTAILNDEPAGISQIAPATPPGLQRVVHRCLEKSPEQRFQSASDLAFALEALSDSGLSSSAISQSAQQPRRRIPLGWAAGVAALVLLAAAAYYITIGRQSESPIRVTGYTQLTRSGNAGEVIATDGARIYISSGVSEPIGQLAVSGGEIEPLTQAPAKAWLNDVSPDGATILYQSYESGDAPTAPIYSMKILGGSPRYIATVAGATWAPDGKSILYTLPGGDLFQVKPDGTDPHKLFSMGSGIADWSVSPDGKRIRYFKNDSLWEMTLSGEGLHAIFADWHAGSRKCCGSWSPDGSFFAFRSGPGAQLWALDERPRLFRKPSVEPAALTSGPIRWGNSIFSKDGKQLFSTGSTRHGGLIRFDAKSKQFLPFLGGISADLLSFSKDGRTVAYSTYPDEVLWKSNVDGTGRVQLTDPPMAPEWVSMSPDGSQVAFMSTDAKGSTRSYVVSSQGGSPQLLMPQGAGSETDPSFSPDGRKIVFATHALTDARHPTDVRVLDLDTHQVVTLPDSAGKYSAHWSPDGQSLIASARDNSGMYLFDFKTQRWSQIYKGLYAYGTWSRDGRSIYALRFAGDRAVLRIPVKGGAAEVAADLKGIDIAGPFSIWLGLDPSDAPLLLRNTGTSDVYALTLERK